ncbi:hypothetical protein F5Y17DRAFT_475617 [Xylariaceae sp. FL0594]|nr:hypothetical protein F5Y17DRAFT_475617 [Xylariaceae sp. FL0594]
MGKIPLTRLTSILLVLSILISAQDNRPPDPNNYFIHPPMAGPQFNGDPIVYRGDLNITVGPQVEAFRWVSNMTNMTVIMYQEGDQSKYQARSVQLKACGSGIVNPWVYWDGDLGPIDLANGRQMFLAAWNCSGGAFPVFLSHYFDLVDAPTTTPTPTPNNNTTASITPLPLSTSSGSSTPITSSSSSSTTNTDTAGAGGGGSTNAAAIGGGVGGGIALVGIGFLVLRFCNCNCCYRSRRKRGDNSEDHVTRDGSSPSHPPPPEKVEKPPATAYELDTGQATSAELPNWANTSNSMNMTTEVEEEEEAAVAYYYYDHDHYPGHIGELPAAPAMIYQNR